MWLNLSHVYVQQCFVVTPAMKLTQQQHYVTSIVTSMHTVPSDCSCSYRALYVKNQFKLTLELPEIKMLVITRIHLNIP